MAETLVEQVVPWEHDIVLKRDKMTPDGTYLVACFLKPLQARLLLDITNFPEGVPITLPQPDASYETITVLRFDRPSSQTWHFLLVGDDLSIPAQEWPAIVTQIQSILDRPLD